MSVKVDMIYLSDSLSREISEFFYNYQRYFAHISVFYQYIDILLFFRGISQNLIDISVNRKVKLHKMELLGGSQSVQNCKILTSHALG